MQQRCQVTNPTVLHWQNAEDFSQKLAETVGKKVHYFSFTAKRRGKDPQKAFGCFSVPYTELINELTSYTAEHKHCLRVYLHVTPISI